MSYKFFFSFAILLGILSACSNNGASSNTISTPSVKSNDVIAGEKERGLCEAKCALCHGFDGTAGIGNAANLQTSTSDSTSMIRVMMNGKGTMPSFKEQLTEAEIGKLVNYVHSLRK